MRSIGEITEGICHLARYIESPIESQLLTKMIRDTRFTLVNDGEHAGEGLFMYPQRQVGPYRADLIIIGVGYNKPNRVWPPNVEVTMAVECDGEQFHSLPDQIEYDKQRDAYFLERGIKTLRFRGAHIYADASFCIDEIYRAIQQEMFECPTS